MTPTELIARAKELGKTQRPLGLTSAGDQWMKHAQQLAEELAAALEVALAENERLKAAMRPIPVSERLPTEKDGNAAGEVLWLYPKRHNPAEVQGHTNGWQYVPSYATHWLPIPKLDGGAT